MTMRQNLICTIGTSLLYPNLAQLPKTQETYGAWLAKQPLEDREFLKFDLIDQLHKANMESNIQNIARLLIQIPAQVRVCGAEINSVDLLHLNGEIPSDCNVFLFYSDTPDGNKACKIIETYFKFQGYQVNEPIKIENLTDDNPKLFRTKGLRNLAKEICQILRSQGVNYSSINATGGYKAQIAVAVLIGQALGVPVYYKHERFNEIISFPPMPISLDFELWLKTSGWLMNLEKENQLISFEELAEDWDEQFETLVEHIDIDGKDFLILSATGQIYLDTFKGKFESDRDQILPPAVNQKCEPHLTDHSWGNARDNILNFLNKIVNNFSYVYNCRTHYWNPDLSSQTLFRLRGDEIEGIYSNGSWTVKFFIETSAITPGQKKACVADLNYQLIKD